MLISWLKNTIQFAPMSLSFLLFKTGFDKSLRQKCVRTCARVCAHAYARTRMCARVYTRAHAYARMRVPAHAHVLALGQTFKQLLFFSSGLDSTNLGQKRLRWIYDRKMNSEKDFEKTCLYTHTHARAHTHMLMHTHFQQRSF